MTDPDALNVWNNQRLVGHLWRNATNTIGFRYDPQWITQGGFAVSHTLPLSNDDFIATFQLMKPLPPNSPNQPTCPLLTSSYSPLDKYITH